MKSGPGRRSRLRWARSWQTAATTASAAPPSAPTSRQRAGKGVNDSLLAARGAGSPVKHCLADALGRRLAFHLTVREAEDCKAYDALIGLPERTPDALLADKGYDADAIRTNLPERNIEAAIPGRSNRRVKIEHGAQC